MQCYHSRSAGQGGDGYIPPPIFLGRVLSPQLCYVMSCYVMLYYIILYYIILYYTDELAEVAMMVLPFLLQQFIVCRCTFSYCSSVTHRNFRAHNLIVK